MDVRDDNIDSECFWVLSWLCLSFLYFFSSFMSFQCFYELSVAVSNNLKGKCWPDTNGLLDISPAKMGLFKISRELQFGLCNPGQPPASPCRQGVENPFIERKRKLGWLQETEPMSPCHERKGSSLLPVGPCCDCRTWEIPIWPTNSI